MLGTDPRGGCVRCSFGYLGIGIVYSDSHRLANWPTTRLVEWTKCVGYRQDRFLLVRDHSRFMRLFWFRGGSRRKRMASFPQTAHTLNQAPSGRGRRCRTLAWRDLPALRWRREFAVVPKNRSFAKSNSDVLLCSVQHRLRIDLRSRFSRSLHRKTKFLRTAAPYSIRYSTLIPRRSISSRKVWAGTSRSCKTAPCLLTAPMHIICSTMDAGNAVVRIMALISLLGS